MGYKGTKEERYEKNRKAQVKYLSDPIKAAAHRERVAARAARVRQEQCAYLNEIKSQPCTDCDIRFPTECMDFDHVRGQKVKDVAKMIGFSWPRLLSEIAKCEVVCSNCHRIRTKRRRTSTTTQPVTGSV